MTASLIKLSTGDIASLVDALKSGRLPAPYSPVILNRYVSNSVVDDVVHDLRCLTEAGFTGEQRSGLLGRNWMKSSNLSQPAQKPQERRTGTPALSSESCFGELNIRCWS